MQTTAAPTRFLLTRAVLADVTRTGRPAITHRAEVDATFGGVAEFLLALQHRWSTALMARLDALIEEPPDDTDAAVRDLWDDPDLGGRGIRAVLDAHADDPDLAAAQDAMRLRVRQDLGVEIPRRRAAASLAA